MPDAEGLALARLAGQVSTLPPGGGGDVIVEIGAYCGRSTLYLSYGILAARGDVPPGGRSPSAGQSPSAGRSPSAGQSPSAGRPVVLSVDHHHGSEEMQAGWEHHHGEFVDPGTGVMDTLPTWRHNIASAGVESLVIGVIGDSQTVATSVSCVAGLVFIDGGHGSQPAWADYRCWAPRVALGGWLAIHDVFPDPADGGRPPFEVYMQALHSGAFREEHELHCGSLRVLRRVSSGV